MEEFKGFTAEDFDVFSINGLDERMEAIRTQIRPKLEALGSHFSPILSEWTGDELHPHVAKHARRTINPPKDTWVAFAASKRGYKMLPHFQIGLWETHLFVWFAVIYEAPVKADFGEALTTHLKEIRKQIPDSFVWSSDHTKPDSTLHGSLTDSELENRFQKLKTVKKAEILCGINISREQAERAAGGELIKTFSDTFQTLAPLYKLSQTAAQTI